MNRKFFECYQYIAPIVLTPLAFWLWWQTFEGELSLVLIAWLLPILYAYIVPGVGTNVLKVWEFDTRIRLGKFRPQHGFVFGSATALIAWLCYVDSVSSGLDVIKYSLICASVLGFWNIIYDIKAIKSGILKVYNQPWADRQSAEAITMDYAPWFFAGFGAVYGAGLAGAELLVNKSMLDPISFIVYFCMVFIASIVVPVIGYRFRSFKMHGHSGCKPVVRQE